MLERTGLPAELLQLEVTESDLLGPAGRQVDAISSLAAMGIRMALDDFGSGYSNLGYLPRLPLHTLKIAGILVEGLRDRTAGAVPVVANLVQLAHELGLQVTAEGVETGDQAAQLRGCGCDSAQGWLYAKAAPLSALAYLLEGDPPADLPDPGLTGRAVPGPAPPGSGPGARSAAPPTRRSPCGSAPCPWFPRTISAARWACSSSTAVGSPRTTWVRTGTVAVGRDGLPQPGLRLLLQLVARQHRHVAELRGQVPDGHRLDLRAGGAGVLDGPLHGRPGGG